MTFREIAESFNITSSRVTQIYNKAIKIMKKPERACFYQDGYIKTLMRIQHDQEEYERRVIEKVHDVVQNPELLNVRINDMEMTVRTTNCLIRAKIDTLEDLLNLMADGLDNIKRIRNLGKTSYNELMRKLEDYGIKADMI